MHNFSSEPSWRTRDVQTWGRLAYLDPPGVNHDADVVNGHTWSSVDGSGFSRIRVLMVWGQGCGLYGLGGRVDGLGFGVQGSGFRVQGVGFRV